MSIANSGDEFDNPIAGVASPFSYAAQLYRAAGWRGTLPLPEGRKNPPPTGTTGTNAPLPTDEQIGLWRADPERQGANICLRLAEVGEPATGATVACEVIAIDVDHYTKGGRDKRGGDQLAALEEKLGQLPDTWISSARTDGVSGIRYFVVPAGLAYRGQVAKDIECISRGYRFAVVWPSTNPDTGGSTYWWFRPGVRPNAEGRASWKPETDALPDPATLPELPKPWLDYLTQGGMRASDDDIDMDSSVQEIYDWADATFNAGDEKATCPRVRKSRDAMSAEILAEATHHDKITKAHWHLYSLAAEGHTGWKWAVDQVDAVWANDVIDRDKRSRDELTREIFRSRTNALRKIKRQVEAKVAKGAAAVAANCPCVPILPGEPDPDFADDVAAEARKLRVREKARQLNAADSWTEPDDQGDLAHQIDHPDPDPGFLVDGLIPARAFVMINAQYKVGKSTLASVNLTHALVTGSLFLGRFATALDARENVAIWNLEVDKPTLIEWLSKASIPRAAQNRIFPMCLRGNRSVDISNDQAAEWTVRWLAARRVAVWIIDPLSKLYRGDDESNHEFNQWWLRIEDIATRAGVRVVVIVHHTGHSESAADRARGASAMMGNPDVLMTYRHDGKHGALPKTTKRYLAAFGRNVNVAEFEVEFTPSTGALRATGSGIDRHDAARRNRAIEVWRYLNDQEQPVKKTALLEALDLPATGRGAAETAEILAYAERLEWVGMTPNGNAKLYAAGPNRPPETKVVAISRKAKNAI